MSVDKQKAIPELEIRSDLNRSRRSRIEIVSFCRFGVPRHARNPLEPIERHCTDSQG
jgi:hypothetical protein